LAAFHFGELRKNSAVSTLIRRKVTNFPFGAIGADQNNAPAAVDDIASSRFSSFARHTRYSPPFAS
jgi:hypothetical protein